MPENWQAVQVFIRCQLERVDSAGGPVVTGVKAGEVHAAMELMQIAADQRGELYDSIMVLSAETCRYVNAVTREAAARRRG